MPDNSANNIIEKTSEYVSKSIKEKMPKNYLFHNLKHTKRVAKDSASIGLGSGLSEEEVEPLVLAAWFHDIGYAEKYVGHEDSSKELARNFLKEQKYPEEKIDQVLACIEATRMPQQPKNMLERSLCDADLASLGKGGYGKRSEKIRIEWEIAKKEFFSEVDWVQSEIDFLEKHEYHTAFAQKKFNKRKADNLKKLKKRMEEFQKGEHIAKSILKKKKDVKPAEKEPTRGIETMFRVTLTNHIRLSAIADNKANIMLSINAIIISITVSTLVPNFSDNPRLILPTVVLLAICVITIIFATLSTRPKVTSGIFTEEDIKNKNTNLLFFGNFHGMKLEEFSWGMSEMMKDKGFLYGSMIKDLYFLGKVLAKKYRYLRICYNIFMYGIILAVIAFGLAMGMPSPF